MEKAPVTAKGTIQLPFQLREKYGIRDGGMALLVELPEGILIKRLDADSFDSFVGRYAEDLPNAAELQAWHEEEIRADETRIKSLP